MPDPKNNDALLEWGQRVVEGNAKAAVAGYPAMVNPSAAEVQTVLDTARAEMKDVPLADMAYDQAQTAAAAERDKVDGLIKRVNLLLDYKLYNEDAASTRRIKRTFGFSYTYQSGETPDPDDMPSSNTEAEVTAT